MILVRLAPANVTPPNREELTSQTTYLRSALLTRELTLIPSSEASLWRDLSTSSSSRRLLTTDLEDGARVIVISVMWAQDGSSSGRSPYKRFFLIDSEKI